MASTTLNQRKIFERHGYPIGMLGVTSSVSHKVGMVANILHESLFLYVKALFNCEILSAMC